MRYLIALMIALAPLHAHAEGTFVTYEADGKLFEGYSVNGGKNSPFLLLVHDWDGLTDYEVKRAEMLGELGYAVFAVDLYGKGVRPVETEDKKKMTASLYGDRARMRQLLAAGLEEARSLGNNPADGVAFGYCFGGAVVLELARSGEQMKGFVSFHGGLTTPDGQNYKETRGQVLVLHGTADASVSMEDFASLAKQLEENSIRHEMITYSGAPHAFTVFGSNRYREDADKKSWKRFTGFIEEVLTR